MLTEMPFTKLEQPRKKSQEFDLFFILEKKVIYLCKFYFSNAVKSIKLEPDDSIPHAKQIFSCERYLAAAAVLAESRGIPGQSQAPVLVKGYEELFVYLSVKGQ